MKIAFVQPANNQKSGKWKAQGVYRTPTNLAILASYVRENGYDPKIYDFDLESGNSIENARTIMSDNPDVIGFTCLTPRFPLVVEIANECKKIKSNVVTVVGGSHVNGQPKHVVKYPSIDYAILGEGEEALLDLLNHIEEGKDVSNLPNLAFEKDGNCIVNPKRPYIEDLNTLPFPAWDLLNLDYYTDPAFFNGPHLGILSGRGCPFNCNFCASKVVWGRNTRVRSAISLADEIEIAIKEYNIREFMFYDDTFTINKNMVRLFHDEIVKRKMDIRFYAQVRVDTIDYELVTTLKKSGCFAVAIGVESGNDQILKNIHKNLNKEQIRKACKDLKRANMPFLASYIIGHPGDTHETIKATIDFADEIDADQSKFLIATPYPGTELYNLAVSKGVLKEEGAESLGDHTYFQHVAANLSEVSDEELLKYQQLAFDNYDLKKSPLV